MGAIFNGILTLDGNQTGTETENRWVLWYSVSSHSTPNPGSFVPNLSSPCTGPSFAQYDDFTTLEQFYITS